MCEVTKRPRRTVVSVPCNPAKQLTPETLASLLVKGWEGKKADVCNYYLEFPPSQYGCPYHYDDDNDEPHTGGGGGSPQQLGKAGNSLKVPELLGGIFTCPILS